VLEHSGDETEFMFFVVDSNQGSEAQQCVGRHIVTSGSIWRGTKRQKFFCRCRRPSAGHTSCGLRGNIASEKEIKIKS